MRPIWTVIIAVIITAGLVGGGGYYYLNQQAEDEKAELQTQIDDLTDQVSTLKKASTNTTNDDTSSTSTAPSISSSTKTASGETSDWETYSDDNYGFSLKHPEDWKIDVIKSSLTEEITISDTSVDEKPTIVLKVYSEGNFGGDSANFSYDATVISRKLSMKSLKEIGTEVEESIEAAKDDDAGYPTNVLGDEGTADFEFGSSGNRMFITTEFTYGEVNYRETLYDILSSIEFTN